MQLSEQNFPNRINKGSCIDLSKITENKSDNFECI